MNRDDVLLAVSKCFGISRRDLLSAKRRHDIVVARHAAMWLLRETKNYSLPQIGSMLKRDHSTTLHGIRMTESRMKEDSAFRKNMAALRDQFTLCENCGLYPADLPSRICPGCEAYQEHQR